MRILTWVNCILKKKYFLLHCFKAVLVNRYIMGDAYIIKKFQENTLKIILMKQVKLVALL